MAGPRRTGVAAAAVAALALLVPALPASAHEPGDGHAPQTLLEAPLAGSLPSDPQLFGVKPGALPWVIESGTASVRADGRLEAEVEGLVVPVAPANGTNPVPRLSASLVCNGTVMATTATVPFSTSGRAEISAQVSVPRRCLAPAVLLHPNGNPGLFIAVTGSAG
jgi:hypothetical protein